MSMCTCSADGSGSRARALARASSFSSLGSGIVVSPHRDGCVAKLVTTNPVVSRKRERGSTTALTEKPGRVSQKRLSLSTSNRSCRRPACLSRERWPRPVAGARTPQRRALPGRAPRRWQNRDAVRDRRSGSRVQRHPQKTAPLQHQTQLCSSRSTSYKITSVIETSSRASSTPACRIGGEARRSAGSSGPARSRCRSERTALFSTSPTPRHHPPFSHLPTAAARGLRARGCCRPHPPFWPKLETCKLDTPRHLSLHEQLCGEPGLTRLLRRLRAHSLIAKVPHSRRGAPLPRPPRSS